MDLSELGEFGLIDRLASGLEMRQPSTLKGIGDDAAVLDRGNGEVTLVSTDLLVEGIHFDLTYAPLKHLGYKAVAVNVSDIAAMNGVPEQITVSMALSSRFGVEAIDELYAGIYAACEHYKVDLVGGDTTSSPRGLLLSVTAIGRAKRNQVSYRGGAKPGDIICVTGDLGGAYLGLQILEREKAVYQANPEMQPELAAYEYVVMRQLKPEARTDIIHGLADVRVVPTSMIDVSDGLASELGHICQKSGVGATIYDQYLPVSEQSLSVAMEFQIGESTAALHGGEDYELLFTIAPDQLQKIKNDPDITVIGQIEPKEAGMHLITRQEQRIPIKGHGYTHF